MALPPIDRRRAHGTAVAPGLAPPTVSPPYHLRRPPPHLICHCRSKPIPSPPLHAPHCLLYSVALEPTSRGTANHQRPLKSVASSTTIPVRQATLVIEPLFIREPHHHAPKIAEAISRQPPSSTGTSPWTAATDPPSVHPTPPRGPLCHPTKHLPLHRCRQPTPEALPLLCLKWIHPPPDSL
jgi:hypothetical protein